MSVPMNYPVQLAFDADRKITRWHPLVQWVLAIPHLIIAEALSPAERPEAHQLLHRAVHGTDPTAVVRHDRHDLPV